MSGLVSEKGRAPDLARPYRYAGSARPAELAGLPLPPARLPLLRDGRLLKRWRYVSIWSSTVLACAARVQVGPVWQEFWAVWDRRRRQLYERTRLIPLPRTVWVDEGRVLVRDRAATIAVALEEVPGFEVVTPVGRAFTWTRKQLVRAAGAIRVGGRALPVDAMALIDDNAGYHPRQTRWQWSGGAGIDVEGRAVGWSVIVGLNDAPEASEQTIWVEGEPREVGPVRFADDLSALSLAEGGSLRFLAESVRRRRDELGLIRSAYRQPFGAFTGTLPGGIELREAYGVMEHHAATW